RDEPASKRINNVYLAGSLLAEITRPIGSNAPTISYFHTDALGSPIAKTNAAGAIIETSEYEPYGRLLNRNNDDRAGYTGHVMDAVSGLINMQQRMFDPQIGRFLSVDPVTAYDNGDMRFFNRFAYAFDNPYRFMDPDGRAATNQQKPCGTESCPEPKPEEKPQRPEPPKGCWVTRDCYFTSGQWRIGRFNWNEAVAHWRRGSGSTVIVGAKQLNLKGATYRKNPDGSYLIHTPLRYDTGAIYGTVTAVSNPDGSIRFLADTYNFDFKNPFGVAAEGERMRLLSRDIFNGIGILINGPGMGYRIDIEGNAPLPGGWK
ncbi:RHS repeat-associated core domain-containing protein, partial [Thermomonas sp. RSS23]